ncbi:MAG: bifunctional phosphopantothenoylcysteine decarboxylase/phosphopantothenate--cysteine ligase CoaBC [Rhodospirillales bacterium]|nr:bifunctional phosphopantothenoylcysteine decarboxylase/phosphopantothenate--cysteine ligase CoaBC [Rhodospirillales bacterium]MBO6788536.1 bifunctional phosphopantothenoylcysteine decarboxylase/phosphopantothenate--cysteine ligase CoaBC [Rhodospirillales bacterium]
MQGKRVLLIVSGGIAAIKIPETIRRIREQGAAVRCVLTEGGAQFVTPLSLSALSEDKVYTDIFSLTDEHEMGHINLSRDADVLMVAPASADIMAKMAAGMASDLATTVLLATDKPVICAPAMNVRMWEHPATQANIQTLKARGVTFVGPEEGDMACGEYGMGRTSEPAELVAALRDFFSDVPKPLEGRHAVVTSGPTHEPIDPVRYIANRSSGKQGHAIAAALAKLGCRTTLVTGPTVLPDPAGCDVIHIESARDMLAAVEKALPADIAVCAAAVADWRTADAPGQKIKKQPDSAPPALSMVENPDILATLSAAGNKRPTLVIGFAAETDDVIANARSKRDRKGCDWIVANDVSPATGTFAGDDNTVHLITGDGEETWPRMSKADVATQLVARIAATFEAAE